MMIFEFSITIVHGIKHLSLSLHAPTASIHSHQNDRVKRPNQPRDTCRLAKSIVDVYKQTGTEPIEPPSSRKPAGVALGILRGLERGNARAKNRIQNGELKSLNMPSQQTLEEENVIS